jgi:acetyl esterase
MDPALSLMLRLTSGKPPKKEFDLQYERKKLKANSLLVAGLRERLYKTELRRIPGSGGDIRIKIYVPGHKKNYPLVLYFHGGGFTLGNIETTDHLCRFLARKLDMAVVSAEYRLSPESVFPAAVEDALTALKWVRSKPEGIPADFSRIILAGDSAGGNLAAVTARKAAERKQPVSAMMMFYPWIDLSDTDSESFRQFAEGYLLTKYQILWFRNNYLGGSNPQNEDISPLLSETPADFPPAVICTSEFDVLRDQGDKFAEKLKKAGNRVLHISFRGQIHGFMNLTTLFRKKICYYLETIKLFLNQL